MTAISPRDGLRHRARRLLSRLAAVVVVGAIAVGSASTASAADDADAEKGGDPAVALSVSTGAGSRIEPGGPLLAAVTVTNDTENLLSAGSVSFEINDTPLADGSALDTWLDLGTAPGGFRSLATEKTPAVPPGESAQVSTIVDADALGDLRPGVYPVQAQLTGATTDDADDTTWDVSATSVMVVAAPGERTVGVLVPITATPEDGSLLTADELTELTASDGDLTGQLDAVTGTTAIVGVDPAIPAAIRMLGTRAPQSAVDWLDRLEGLANDVFALRFADADAAVQSHAELSQGLDSLDLRPLIQPADLPQAQPEATPTPGPTPSGDPVLPDNAELTGIGGARTDILWPDADVTAADLDAFDAYVEGRAVTVLPSTALNATAVAHSTVDGHDVLVLDAPTSARMSATVEQTDVGAAERQLAGAAGHLFFAGKRSSTVLVGLERSESRSPVALRELLSTFASPDVRLSALTTSDAARTRLIAEANTSRSAALTAMLDSEKRLRAFSSILDEPGVLLTPERIRLLRAIRVGLSDEAFTGGVTDRAARVRTILDSVGIQRPKPVQLITSAAPLPVWVRNDLPWPVRVTLHSDPSDPRLDITPSTEVEAGRSGSTRVDVPIQARVASGEVEVDFELTSPTGVAIGRPATADVTLRADWEGIGIGILGGVIAVLFVLGLIRTIRRRRRNTVDTTSAEEDE
ncbi:DUF6049 family protein [Microbacterium sp. NPDC058342]|uniref:DUF6049 family protein n=1 Tax=Microbacterium sp. NPDC058342 TaxID=3346454 RepID=UPI003659A7E0